MSSILCIVFVVIGLSVVLQNPMIMVLEIPLIISAIIYAIFSPKHLFSPNTYYDLGG